MWGLGSCRGFVQYLNTTAVVGVGGVASESESESRRDAAGDAAVLNMNDYCY